MFARDCDEGICIQNIENLDVEPINWAGDTLTLRSFEDIVMTNVFFSGVLACEDEDGIFRGIGIYSSTGSYLPTVASPFQDLRSITSILDSDASTPFIPDYCDGFRCTLGQCIPLGRVCDRY